MEKEKISVIIPVYNVEKYLPKCLDSVMNQTYKNLEIIIVDDGSPDNCPKICDEYAEKDGRIKVIHKENGGLSSARNAGLDIATGEYIGFVDSDDWIEENMYELLIKEISEKNTDIVCCAYYLEKEYTEIQNTPEHGIINGREWLKKVFNCSWIDVVVWNRLYKKSLISNVYFDEQLNCCEDNRFLYDISSRIKSVSYLNIPLYHYNRMNVNSITGGGTDYSESMMRVRDYFVDETKHDNELHQIALLNLVLSYTILIKWAFQTKNKEKNNLWIMRLKKYEKEIYKNPLITPRKKLVLFVLFHFRFLYEIIYYMR